MNKQNILLATSMFATIILFRLIGIPNFNPTIAIAVICGAFVANRSLALLLPMAALLMADIALGLSSQDASYMQFITSGAFVGNYFFYLFAVLAGRLISKRMSLTTTTIATLTSAIIFFFGSNLLSWFTMTEYTKDAAGLMNCYVAAIPFLNASVVSNISVAILLYFAYTVASRKKVSFV